MAGQRKLKDQKLLTAVLRETPAQLSSRYIRLCKKLHKKIKLGRNCGIIAAASAAVALAIGVAVASQGALLPVVVSTANTVALNGMSGIYLLVGVRKLKRHLAIVEAALEARGISPALLSMEL